MKDLLENWNSYLQEAADPCWDGYKKVGMKKKGAKMVPNCVPLEEDFDEEPLSDEEVEVDEGKICDAGISYVLRTDAGNKGKDIHRGSDGKLKNWSARAAQIASKKCKDPNYGTGKSKKNEEIEEAEGGLKAWEKEEWVHSDGRPCGSGDKDGSKSRCKPKSKWKTMSKKEKKADDAKKSKGTKAGKQYVPATKKGKVTKAHTKREGAEIIKQRLMEIINEEVENVLRLQESNQEYYEVEALDENEEYCPVCAATMDEAKKKKPCKPSKGKRFAKRVDGKCRSYGQAGQAKGGGDRIRPGTKKGDAYCARSAGIKKCKNPPCANTLSRKKWKCRGKKSMKE